MKPWKQPGRTKYSMTFENIMPAITISANSVVLSVLWGSTKGYDACVNRHLTKWMLLYCIVLCFIPNYTFIKLIPAVWMNLRGSFGFHSQMCIVPAFIYSSLECFFFFFFFFPVQQSQGVVLNASVSNRKPTELSHSCIIFRAVDEREMWTGATVSHCGVTNLTAIKCSVTVKFLLVRLHAVTFAAKPVLLVKSKDRAFFD